MEVLRGKEIIQATEATEDDGSSWITLVKEGTSINNRNYKRAALEKAVNDRVYEGINMFVDHSDKPPIKRSFRDLVAGIGETKLDTSFPDGAARIRGRLKWFDEEFGKKAIAAKEHTGISHDAKLWGSRTRLTDGRRYEEIDEIQKVHSVDWVVYPSAGGGFEEFYGREGVEVEDIDWDAIDEDMLKKHKPDLYKSLTERAQESVDDDEDDEDEEEDPAPSVKKGAKPVIKALDEHAIEGIVSKSMDNYFKQRQTSEAVQKQIAGVVNKSTLPALTKERVIKSFDGAESFEEDRVKEAIEDAKNELAAVAGPKIRGAGNSTTGGGTKKQSLGRAHEAVEAAFSVGLPKKKVNTKGKGSDDDDEDEEEE